MSLEIAYSPNNMAIINGKLVGNCPICDREIEQAYTNFCPRCGTHILWDIDNEYSKVYPKTIRHCREMINFDKYYINDEYGSIYLYFNAPSDILDDDIFDKAVSAKISIEFPTDNFEHLYAADGIVKISPVFEPDKGLVWYDDPLPYGDIDMLLSIYNNWRETNHEK